MEIRNGRLFYIDDAEGKLIAQINFYEENDIFYVVHTMVNKEYEGQGIASKLVQQVVDAAIAEEKTIKPICWYVVKWFEKHQEYQYLLAK